MQISFVSASRHAFCRFLVAAILLCPLPVPAAGEDRVIFCFNAWPPFAYQVDDAIVGISVDLINEAARRLEITVEYRELPWNRCLQYVKDGSVHAVVDAAEREDFIQGPTSLSIYSDTLWVHLSSPTESPKDLKNARIGLVDGYQYSDKLTDMIDRLGMSTELSVDDPANLRKLAFRRTDVAIADLVGTIAYTKQHRLNLRPLLPPVSYDPLYLSFHSNFGEQQQRFDQVFRVLLDEGFVDQVYESHIGKRFSDLIPAN